LAQGLLFRASHCNTNTVPSCLQFSVAMAVSRVITLVSLLVVACNSLNIVETAQADGTFSILVEALIAANLTSTLSGTGPFTVFAPTNAAFTAALTALSIDKPALLARTDLPDILKYHVLPGKLMAADLNAFQTPATVQGGMVIVEKSSAGVTFGGANVSTPDLSCDNGVIHVIDSVVLPPSMNIVQTAQATADVSVLVEALVAADLTTTLSGTGPFTVFAPTNAAFTALLTNLSVTKAELLARSDLPEILKYHVLSGKTMSSDLQASQSPATVQGSTVAIMKDSAGVTFGAAQVTLADTTCSNGVIHLIDTVVLPPTSSTTDASSTSTTAPAALASTAAAESLAAVAVGVAIMVFA